jgi:hypothetical protein
LSGAPRALRVLSRVPSRACTAVAYHPTLLAVPMAVAVATHLEMQASPGLLSGAGSGKLSRHHGATSHHEPLRPLGRTVELLLPPLLPLLMMYVWPINLASCAERQVRRAGAHPPTCCAEDAPCARYCYVAKPHAVPYRAVFKRRQAIWGQDLPAQATPAAVLALQISLILITLSIRGVVKEPRQCHPEWWP